MSNQTFDPSINGTAGRAQRDEGLSFASFLASLGTAVAIFSAQFLLFYILKTRMPRIYQPKTYLVPRRERVEPPPPGLLAWVRPVFRTSSSEFIQKCGIDSYLFLRYMRLLLKIFVPMALVILPILLPINSTGANNGVSGMDKFGWQNIGPSKVDRLTAHLVLAILVVIHICYVVYDELRMFVRLRQAYITSPQHRLRASATTVLVQNIPIRWLSYEALDGLYDVFPGGIRNIWINRKYDSLQNKVKLRNKVAKRLEKSETDFIMKIKKVHKKQVAKQRKAAGEKLTGSQRKEESLAINRRAHQMANDVGMSSGNPHQVPRNIDEALSEAAGESDVDGGASNRKRNLLVPTSTIDKKLESVGQEFSSLGHRVVGGLRGGIGSLRQNVRERQDGGVKGEGIDEKEESAQPRTAEDDNLDLAEKLAVDNSYQDPRQVPAIPNAKAETSNTDTDAVDGSLYRTGDAAFDKSGEYEMQPITDDGAGWKSWLKDTNLPFKRRPGEEYYNDLPPPYDENFVRDDSSAEWRKYLRDKDRETMRIPLFPRLWWFPSLPFVGQKVDVIYYCRKELARLNQEVEDDQANPERFPLMNSAFIQFNHQVAAHMACQSISHHVPKQMAPRSIEISPNDVLWHNMSIKWWERYIRTAFVLAAVIFITITWAFPVTFTGALSQISYLSRTFDWLAWMKDMPDWLISLIQGTLPAALLAVLLFVLPIILRFLADVQGASTGAERELWVQDYHFALLFVQVFLVVSISTGILSALQELINDPRSVPSTLAANLPKASNYFFSFMILQALSTSASDLLQISMLLVSFVIGPFIDKTARQKFKRNIQMQDVKWGKFFPFYTNLAAIGVIYSIISPLILLFNVLTFALFWVVYRYVTLYINRVQIDTGGLMFPKAINQLFTGVYVMELALIGLFFITGGTRIHGFIMIAVFILTALYQFILNDSFGALSRYIPITLEDEAARRDEEFARAQDKRFSIVKEEEEGGNDIEQALAKQEQAEARENREAAEMEAQMVVEAKKRPFSRRSGEHMSLNSRHSGVLHRKTNSKPDLPSLRSRRSDVSRTPVREAFATKKKEDDATSDEVPPQLDGQTLSYHNVERRRHHHHGRHHLHHHHHRHPDKANEETDTDLEQGPDPLSQSSTSPHFRNRTYNTAHTTLPNSSTSPRIPTPNDTRITAKKTNAKAKAKPKHKPDRNAAGPTTTGSLTSSTSSSSSSSSSSTSSYDVESQRGAVGDILFSGITDEIEDLTPEERDRLVQHAFQHAAVRARRPVVWIPRDDLGVSDDEVRRTQRLCGGNVWVSNDYTGLDAKGQVVIRRAPPDYSEVDLIRL